MLALLNKKIKTVMDLIYTIISGSILLISFYQQVKIHSLEKKTKTLSDALINSYVIHSAMMNEMNKKQDKKEDTEQLKKTLND